MRHLFKHLSLLMLLLLAQQGALVHEFSHVSHIGSTEAKPTPGLADSTCALCPAFAQVVTPAFSHSFDVPLLVRAALEPSTEPLYGAVDTAIPTPRSRGPPSKT
jgi:hypothetical protein